MPMSRVLAALSLLLLGAAQADATYRVRYRASPAAPWRAYATTPAYTVAQGEVGALRAGGYQAQAVAIQPIPHHDMHHTHTTRHVVYHHYAVHHYHYVHHHYVHHHYHYEHHYYVHYR